MHLAHPFIKNDNIYEYKQFILWSLL